MRPNSPEDMLIYHVNMFTYLFRSDLVLSSILRCTLALLAKKGKQYPVCASATVFPLLTPNLFTPCSDPDPGAVCKLLLWQ